jgi:hypothetical protein
MIATELTKAQDSLKQLLGMMEFQRVVCVDDDYATNVSVNVIIAKCRELIKKDVEKLKRIDEFSEIDFISGEDDWEELLSATWEEIDDLDRRNDIYQKLKEMLKDPGAEDPKYSSVLDELLRPAEEFLEFKRLALGEWRARSAEILQQADSVKTLFLFDQDFSKEGASITAGLDLITEVLTSQGSKPIICALLSHHGELGEEQRNRDEIAADRHLDKDKFIFISKYRLSKDPLGFARMVKLTAINEPCMVLKKKTSEVMEKAHEIALKQVDEIGIDDFDHIVFQSSYQEGVWEPDTLFRVFGLYQRKAAREIAKKDPEIESIAASVRPYSNPSC